MGMIMGLVWYAWYGGGGAPGVVQPQLLLSVTEVEDGGVGVMPHVTHFHSLHPRTRDGVVWCCCGFVRVDSWHVTAVGEFTCWVRQLGRTSVALYSGLSYHQHHDRRQLGL